MLLSLAPEHSKASVCCCSHVAACSVFLLFNIALGAYILGTITLLVVKNDERTGRYRDLSTNLKTYRCALVKAQATCGVGVASAAVLRSAQACLPASPNSSGEQQAVYAKGCWHLGFR